MHIFQALCSVKPRRTVITRAHLCKLLVLRIHYFGKEMQTSLRDLFCINILVVSEWFFSLSQPPPPPNPLTRCENVLLNNKGKAVKLDLYSVEKHPGIREVTGMIYLTLLF